MLMDPRSAGWECVKCKVRVTREVARKFMVYGGSPSEIARGYYSVRKILIPPPHLVNV